jgi:single-strand DNA-binding protein
MINNVVLLGRATAKPVLRQTPNGIEVTDVRLAVPERKDANGEERTLFVTIDFWRNNAKFVSQYVEKGTEMCVQGRLVAVKRTNAQGQEFNELRVVCTEISLCRRPATTAAQPQAQGQPVAQPVVATPVVNQGAPAGYVPPVYNPTPVQQEVTMAEVFQPETAETAPSGDLSNYY